MVHCIMDQSPLPFGKPKRYPPSPRSSVRPSAPMTIPQAFDLAVKHHRAGRLAEAEALYRQILSAQPHHAGALHFLGLIAHGAGRHRLAVDLMRQSITFDPDNPIAHSNLGEACRAIGRVDEAMDACRRAIQIMPDFPNAHLNLGNALRDRGDLDQAVAAFRRALQLKPDYLEALGNLGHALRECGRLDEAVAAFRRALQIKPDLPEAHYNLAIALREAGQLDEAIAANRRAVELRPGFPNAHSNLGNALRERGQLDDAIAECRRALQLKPDFPEAHNNLGNALRDRGQLDEAMAAYRSALQFKPDYPEAHYNLGVALRERGRLDEAIVAYQSALQRKPDFPEAHNNLGDALKELGELDEAIASFRRAFQRTPEFAAARSNLVYALHFHPNHDQRTIAEEHGRWNRQFSDPLKQLLQPHANDRDPNRRLRVGYVSPDFRDHPVGRHAWPLFRGHDRERVEILCYSGVVRPDRITERLRELSAGWRNTVGVLDARLAEMIREDAVDILVDLALHTAGNRLPVFAWQPAPVQVSWLGYPGSTGMPGIGYRFTDACMEPPGEESAWSAEEPVRLPDCWCCFEPADDSPEVNALPAASGAGVTFGSLNNFAKVHDGVLALWARALHAVKRSRLLMFCPEGRARERVRAFFGARGIGAERLELACFLPRHEYLSLYHRIDLALDPFPFNGMTTTCDALWMGVPVLTLPGAMPAARAGLSLLSSIGLAELAASSEDDYVRLATELAADLPRLANLRATLRARMLASPLMDAPLFAGNVETAYRSMWRRWCSGQTSTRDASAS